MKTKSLYTLSALSAALALSAITLRADDASAPPAPPQGSSDGLPGEPPPPPPVENGPPPGDNAQPPPHPHHGHQQGFILSELTKKLNLTADQQKTVGGILADSKSKLEALRDDESLSPEDKRAQAKGIRDAERASIRAALTPDQQKIFDTLRPRGGWRQGPPPASGPTPTPTPQS
jgi:hypothetical protein